MPEIILPKFPVGTWDNPIAGVYKFTIDDAFFYIGGSVHLRRRLDQWRGSMIGRDKGHFSPSVKRLMPISEVVVFEVVEYTARENVQDRENFYLQKYKSDPLFINQSPTATDNFGYKIVDDNGKHYIPYPVKKYDANGNLIKGYRSVQRCADEEGVKISHIQRVLSGERNTLKGFTYKAENYPQKGGNAVKIKLERSRGRLIQKFNESGELVATFNRVTDAAKSIASVPQNVRRALSGVQKTAGGFVFKFSEAVVHEP